MTSKGPKRPSVFLSPRRQKSLILTARRIVTLVCILAACEIYEPTSCAAAAKQGFILKPGAWVSIGALVSYRL